MTESQFKERVLKDLKKLSKIYILKTSETSRRGVPDLLICLRGQFIAIELKRDGEVPTPLQFAILKQIMNASGRALWSCPALWENHLQIIQKLYYET